MPFDFSLTTVYIVPFFLLTFGIYWLTKPKFRWIVLLVASVVFYALISWKSIPFILFSSLTIYFTARYIGKRNAHQKAYLAEHKAEMSKEEKSAFKAKVKASKRTALVLGIITNLLVLAAMKYLDFLIGNVNGVISWFTSNVQIPLPHLFLPLGISFYTFQAIGYLVDVYWGKYEHEENYAKFTLFLIYFPKVLQGPIMRFDKSREALFGEHQFDYENVLDGGKRCLYGYLKKLVIADTLAVFVNFAFGNVLELSGLESFLAIFFYFIQDYCDFSGYMDIGIGYSQMLGVDMEENFNHPYFATGIDDYWRRWHMTLGSWFKDYVFYPLSISKFSLALGKKSKSVFKGSFGMKVPAIFGLTVVWLLTGLWHGASWNYVLWGAYYGVLIILSVVFEPAFNAFYAKTGLNKDAWWLRAWRHIRTLFLLMIGRLLFICNTPSDAWTVFVRMWNIYGSEFSVNNILNQIGYISIIAAIVSSIPVLVIDLIQEAKPETSFREKLKKKPVVFRFALYLLLLIFVVWFGYYGSGLPRFEFGYTQF